MEDARNKGIQFHNQMLFAYSGPAEIEGKPSDVWIADVMAERADNLQESVEHLSNKATEHFARLPWAPRWKHFDVRGVGWAQLDDEQKLSPMHLSISNALDEHGRWLPAARATFDVVLTELPETSAQPWTSIGATVPDDVRASLTRGI